MSDFDEWPSYPGYPTYPPSRERMLKERERRFDNMPLDDELSDLRYAPREQLIRAIRGMALTIQDQGADLNSLYGGDDEPVLITYADALQEHNLQDSERNERGAA